MAVEHLYGVKALDQSDEDTHIRLSDLSISCADAEKIASRFSGRDVKSLDIKNSKFEVGAIDILAKAILSKKEHIFVYLTGNSLNDQDAKSLSAVLKNRNIITLDLSDNQIREQGAEALATAISTEKPFSVLKFYKNPFGPKGAAAIALAITHTYKSTLDLSDCELGDEGAVRVADILIQHKHEISELRLVGNGIGLVGDQALAKLPLCVKKITYQTEEVDFKAFSLLEPMKTFSMLVDHEGVDFSSFADKTFTIEKEGLISVRDPQALPSLLEKVVNFFKSFFKSEPATI